MLTPTQTIFGATTFGPCPRPRAWTRTQWGMIAPDGTLETFINADRLAKQFPLDDSENIFRRQDR